MRADLLGRLLVYSGVNRLYRRVLAPEGFPILAWHEIRARSLIAQLNALAPYYRFLSLEDAVVYERRPGSRQALVLTFDDGYRSWCDEVLPYLRSKRIPATFFVCTGFLDRIELPWYEIVERYIRRRRGSYIDVRGERFSVKILQRNSAVRRSFNARIKSMDHKEFLALIHHLERGLNREDRDAIWARYLTWDELRGIEGMDIQIGAHSIRHHFLSRLNIEDMTHEIRGSKERLEEALDRSIDAFAYPNGTPQDIDDRVIRITKASGFRFGLTALRGLNEPHPDPMMLRRVAIPERASLSRVRIAASGLLGRLEDWRDFAALERSGT